jgi:hypothetical protein
MTQDTGRDDVEGPLGAAEQDPSAEPDLGAGPARTDAEKGAAAADDGPAADDVPEAPAGPGATPADPDQPLNPA